MGHSKEWLSYGAQLDRVVGRGLEVRDRERALRYLEQIGYYRLSGYWHVFRQRTGNFCPITVFGKKPTKKQQHVRDLTLDEFKPGAQFEQAIGLYVFDKNLRLLALDALERIEVALRVDIAHTLGELDPCAHHNPELLDRKYSKEISVGEGVTAHHTWLSGHGKLVKRSKERFIKHYKATYGLPLPIWVAAEIWSFGTMSRFFGMMTQEHQDRIARKYGITNGRVFASWLRSLNHLRNICAHHSRLWNRNIDDQPRLPDESNALWITLVTDTERFKSRCFCLLRITRHLMDVINPTSGWAGRVEKHLESNFPDLQAIGVGLEDMGAPSNWREIWHKKPLSANT